MVADTTQLYFGDIITNGVNHWMVIAHYRSQGALLCERCGKGIMPIDKVIFAPVIMSDDKLTPQYIGSDFIEFKDLIWRHEQEFSVHLICHFKSPDPKKWKGE